MRRDLEHANFVILAAGISTIRRRLLSMPFFYPQVQQGYGKTVRYVLGQLGSEWTVKRFRIFAATLFLPCER